MINRSESEACFNRLHQNLLARVDNSAAIRHVIDQDHGISAVKDVTIIDAAQEAIEHEKEISLEYTIANTDRANRCYAFRSNRQEIWCQRIAGTYAECKIQRFGRSIFRSFSRTGS